MNTAATADAQTLMIALQGQLERYEKLAIAVSGGVDSTTLAAVSHAILGERAFMLHAVSPAVPSEATERVHHYAKRFGWSLEVVDAGEFSDDQYRANPVNRCYYCKSNLYSRIQQVWSGAVASGANLDDLGDYRPGLLAASEKQIVHPLIEANINKQGVRLIADHLRLDKVAQLPAQPCLSSRVETGITIKADDLMFVHKVEKYLANALGAGDIRCRIVHAGVRIEVPEPLIQANASHWESVQRGVEELITLSNRTLVGYSNYVRGSTFIHD